MARFSLGKEEEEAEVAPGPSSSRAIAKRQKITSTPPPGSPPLPQPAPPQPPPPPPADGPVETQELVEDEQMEVEEEEESGYEIETDEEESEYEEEEEDDDDEEDEQDEEELENQQPQPEVNVEPSRDGPISVTLTDPDVFDCPICLEPLSIPVFQCENGHIACSSCCTKIGHKCPSCCWPIGYNRCRAMEKVLETVKFSCRNMKYGCKHMMKYSNKHEHEETCILAPCTCPHLFCSFVASTWHLYAHFSHKHPTSAKSFLYNRMFTVSLAKKQKYLILLENNECIIFILSHYSNRHGSAINISRIAAPSSSSVLFSYDLIARDGETSIKLQSPVKSIPRWIHCPPAEKFLLVPSCYISTCAQLKLEVCIRKHQDS